MEQLFDVDYVEADWLLPDVPSSFLNKKMLLLSVPKDFVVYGYPQNLSVATLSALWLSEVIYLDDD